MKKLLLIIPLLVACSARAEFTVAEKQQIANQIKSTQLVNSSMYWAMSHALAFPADVGVVSSYINSAAYNGWENHSSAVLKLLDMFDAAGPRETVRDEAVAAIENVGAYTYARGLLNWAQFASTSLANAKNAMDDAIALRAGFDSSLAYVEPRLDIQLALPGASRTRASVIGPHGSWTDLGFAMDKMIINTRRVWLAVAGAAKTCPAFIAGSRGAAYAASHVQNIGRTAMIVPALAAGIVPDWRLIGAGELQDDLDTMIAGGTTARPPEFFFIQISLEALLTQTHTGSRPYDINGRKLPRGITYDFSVFGQVWDTAITTLDALCPSDDQAAFLGYVGDGIAANDAGWAGMDDVAMMGLLVLKHFQVFPPPGPGGGGGGFTCGEGTHEEGGVCLPDPCPTVVPALDVLPDRILARCVVQ